MRTTLMKNFLGLAGLLAATLLGTVGADAATTVNLTAQRASLTLPDGTVASMWGYCGGAVAGGSGSSYGGSACPATAAATLPTWTQGPTIVVPAGDTLTITLNNTLPSPTSITILGQVGGFIGSPNKVASPVHAGVSATTFPNNAAATFTPLDGKAQPARARSFTKEVDGNGGAAVSYVWNNLKPGTYLYESGSRPSLQVPMGLYGVLVVTSSQTAGATTAPVPGTPGVAYSALVPGSNPAVNVPLAYDADATYLFSEVDVLQNAAVDAAALAMAAKQAPSAANAAFSALEQRVLPPSQAIVTNPTANPGTTAGVDDCATIACYPPAVNYAPTYFLVNGRAYDQTNPAASAQILADNAAAAAGTTATGRVVVRFANAGLKTHIPTIVGMGSLLLAEDGNLQPDVALGMVKTATAVTPLVSGKVQSSLLLPAGKTLDVAITPSAGAAAGTFADSAYPVLDRELSLSGGGKPFSGLQAFLAIAPANTTAATLGTVLGSSGSAILPAGAAIVAKDDVFYLPAGTTTYSGNVLANDVGVVKAVAGTIGSGISLVLNADGSFTVKSTAGAIPNGVTFTYTGTGSDGLVHGPATVTFNVTQTTTNSVTAPAQSFTSNVASLIRVPHPGVLAGASSTGNYTLRANASAALPALQPPPGSVLPYSTPACTGPGRCSVQLFADGAVIATASQPGTYRFTYYAVDSQGVSGSNTATLIFPQGSNAQVTLVDSVTGQALPKGRQGSQDYRWVIEEDQTFLHDPGNAGFVPPAFAVSLPSVSMVTGSANQVVATYASADPRFKGFVAGTYVQINSGVDAFNGVFRINSVSGTAASGSFTYTLWITPPAAAVATGSSGTATTGQSLATNFHRSYMPVVAAGCTGPRSCNAGQTIAGVAAAAQPASLPSDVLLDPTKRYFISVLPGDAGDPAAGLATGGHAMGAAPLTPVSVNGSTWNPVTVLLPQSPIPPGQMSIYVFEDNNPISGDVDDGEPGLGGFEVVIYDTRGSSGDQAGQITYDLFNQPLTNALANQGGTGTDGNYYANLCPTTPNGQSAPVGVIYTCLPVLDKRGHDISPYTGLALVKNVIPGRLDVQAHPAAWREGAGEQWIQVSTLEGTPNNDTFVHPGEPAYWQEFGPPGFHSFIGFVNPAHLAQANADAVAAAQTAKIPVATVTGRVTNLHMDRPPQGKLNDSCQPGTTDASCARAALNYTQCYVALNSQSGNGATVAWAQCDPSTGSFTISNVPADTYEMFIWDEWLDQIKAKQLVTVPTTNADGTPYPLTGGVVAAGDIPVFNWFTRIQETIYVDLNGNGMRDPGEPGLPNLVANVRFRDGTFSNRLTTDAQGNAFHNELFPLFNWYVLENDQTRYKNTGVHIIYDAGGVPDQKNLSANGGLSSTEYFPTLGVLNSTESFPLPPALQVPGAKYNPGKTERIDPPSWITEGMQGFINQTEFIEWGKQPFAPGENGGISGLVYFASVRAFDDPRLKVQNLLEPGIPRVQVNLYQRITNPDGTTSDVLVDTTTSSSWDDWANGTTNGVPNMNCPGNAPASANPPSYVAGQTDPFINYTLGSNNQYKCYDGQHAFNQVQPAVYDGYYAFPTSACSVCTQVALVNNSTGQPLLNPDGTTAAPVPTLPPGQYVVEVVRPDGFEMTKEEDKNILIGDTWITAGPQQFGNLVNMFILPDQATLNDNNPEGQTLFAPPCVGLPHLVPDYLTVVPEAQQTAPYAGQVRPLCDKKLVTVADQTASNADFQLWTPTPIAGHVSGLMLNDAAAEFDPYSPSFGEKFALPNAPVSIRDFNGVEILRSYTDKWGTFDFLNVSTWEANVPNPSGYAPNMLTYCMNDPGPTPDPANPGKYRVDPYYNQQYSDFCYNWPILPGVTTYLDTPVLPVAAFASHYAPVDCQYANLTPAILRVDGNWVPSKAQAFVPATVTTLPTTGTGPFVDLGAAAPQLTITALGDVSVLNPAYAGPTALPGTSYASNRITRHYGFGATASASAKVKLVSAKGRVYTLPVSLWSDQKVVATIPTTGNAAVPAGDYQLVITAANGLSTIDAVTVSLDNSKTNAAFRAPWYVAAPPPGTGIGAGNGWGLPHPIQDAIDSPKVLPGDLVIVDAGLYPELDVMWKPVRLQGVGAAAVTIQATKYPNSKIADWRNRINLLFGLTPEGNQFVDAQGNAYPTQIDPLPGQTVNGGITRLEPTALSTEEGAGITVLAANNQANPLAASGCLSQAQLLAAAPGVTPTVNFTAATPYGFYPTLSPLGGTPAPATANQPVAATKASRFFSDFACYASRIDGISVTGSDAGGGIYVNGWAHDIQISNNRVFGNSGPYAGGVRVGQPYMEGQVRNPLAHGLAYNVNVKIHHNAITTNGTDEANAAPGTPVGTSGAGGGLAIEAGTDNFVVSNNWICGNFSAGDGGGMGVVGNSSPGRISNNTIIFNESYQQTGPSYGGGLAIEGEPAAGTTATTGVGNILVDSNLIQGNSVRSGSGGGVRIALINGDELTTTDPALTSDDLNGNLHAWQVTLSNNIIVNNVAGWSGGGVSVADALFTKVWGNTIANNDTVGTAGILMNTMVNGKTTGPTTSVPNPAGFASDPDSPNLIAAIARFPRNRPQPPSKTISQPTVMSNNIIWHNRSQFFDGAPANKSLVGVQLCASNRWADAVAHNCAPLPAQTSTGQCVTGAKYWDVGVTGDQAPASGAAPTALKLDHSVLSAAYVGTGNLTADPLFAKAYCNGGRVNPGAQFEPGSPFQPNFALNASATLDESGNYVDIQFGPLSLTDPVTPDQANGNYHLASGSPAIDTGVVPSATMLAQSNGVTTHDIDGEARPQGSAFDIGADEYTVPYADIYVGKDDGITTVSPGQTTTYTITVGNAGTLGVNGVQVSDVIPSVVTLTGVNRNGTPTFGTATPAARWSCVGNGAGAACGAAAGTGDLNTTVNLPPQSTVTFTVAVTLPANTAVSLRGNNGARSQTFSNTVRATLPAGVTDANLADNVATDTDTLVASQVDLSIRKVFSGTRSSYQPGETVSYTVTVSNLDPALAAGLVSVSDTPPGVLQTVTWTCAASTGSSCGAASGSGAIAETGATLAPLGTLTYTLTGRIPLGVANGSSLSNTATVAVNAALATDPQPGNNSSTVNGSVQFGSATFTPAQTDLGRVQLGQTATALVTLVNTSGVPMFLAAPQLTVVNSPVATPAQIVLAGTTCPANATLATGASCTASVRFQPTVVGNTSASLVIDGGAGPLTAQIFGQGIPPVVVVGTGSLAVNPASVALTTATPNRRFKTATLTLSNSGTAPLNLGNVVVATTTPSAGTFGFVNGPVNCPINGGNLAVGASCSLTVSYTPNGTANNSGVLTINTPGATTPLTLVNLTGN